MKRILAVSLVLNLLCLVAGLAFAYQRGGFRFVKERAIGPNAIYQPFRQSPLYQGQAGAQEVAAKFGADIFLGDSITAHGQWAELIGCNAVNRGISGDQVLGVKSRLPSILAAKPARIFLMIGINDLAQGGKPADVAEKYKELVEELKAKSQAVLILENILPTQADPLRPLIIETNREIEKLADGTRIFYLDLHSHFVSASGLMDGRYTFDGTHLNGAGYLLWRDVLQAKFR